MTIRYLFHNIYGDADNLIENKPNDVSAIPFGWDESTEQFRNDKLAELNATVSCLPSVLFIYENQWFEIRVEDMEKPWTWDQINQSIQEKIEDLDKIV